MNASGEVVGSSWVPAAVPTYDHTGDLRATLWQADGNAVLVGSPPGESWGKSINDDGTVVGTMPFSSGETSNQHAFRWSASAGLTDLGTFGGRRSGAGDINSAGDIVGFAEDVNGVSHGFLCMAPSSPTTSTSSSSTTTTDPIVAPTSGAAALRPPQISASADPAQPVTAQPTYAG